MTKDEINCLLLLADINKKPKFYAEDDEEERNPALPKYRPLSIKVTDKSVTLTIKDTSWSYSGSAQNNHHYGYMINQLQAYNLPVGKMSTTLTEYNSTEGIYHFDHEYNYSKKYEFTNVEWLNELKKDYEIIMEGLERLACESETICGILF